MKVAFFPGCMVDMMYPEVGIAAVEVLERLGCEVELPKDQICCGQMFLNSGYEKETIPMMKQVVDAYSGYDTIVSLSGSCLFAIVGGSFPEGAKRKISVVGKGKELAPNQVIKPGEAY